MPLALVAHYGVTVLWPPLRPRALARSPDLALLLVLAAALGIAMPPTALAAANCRVAGEPSPLAIAAANLLILCSAWLLRLPF